MTAMSDSADVELRQECLVRSCTRITLSLVADIDPTELLGSGLVAERPDLEPHDEHGGHISVDDRDG